MFEGFKFEYVDVGDAINDSRIIVTDVFASNGVIHAIDRVLLPV